FATANLNRRDQIVRTGSNDSSGWPPKTDLTIFEHPPPPAFHDRRHRGLARRLVAVDRPAVFVVAIGQRPQPWLAYRRGSRLHDAADQAMLLKSRAGDEGQRKDKLSARPTIDTPSAVLTRGGVVLLKTFTSIRHPRLGDSPYRGATLSRQKIGYHRVKWPVP